MKISLRKYKSSDLDRHIELLNTNNDNVSKKNEEKWLKKAIENYDKKVPGFYVLPITLNKKMIGNIIAEKIKPNKELKIGYWIGKPYWDKGYMTKAVKLFSKKVKKVFKVKDILANCDKNNIGSERVLSKSGFKITKRGKDKIYFKKRLK